ncbi:hypothetical protein O7628_01835 [Micromonospora sp. WMMD956]|nr:hypothetical protein [Micromonospora sp. WMMD956]MDG4814248.1 hypothetical protein [Micromonospora sp. WMMD956]
MEKVSLCLSIAVDAVNLLTAVMLLVTEVRNRRHGGDQRGGC